LKILPFPVLYSFPGFLGPSESRLYPFFYFPGWLMFVQGGDASAPVFFPTRSVTPPVSLSFLPRTRPGGVFFFSSGIPFLSPQDPGGRESLYLEGQCTEPPISHFYRFNPYNQLEDLFFLHFISFYGYDFFLENLFCVSNILVRYPRVFSRSLVLFLFVTNPFSFFSKGRLSQAPISRFAISRVKLY